MEDLLRTAEDGRGVISCLELPAVQDKPALFSTALMWLVAELFEELPEVGDLPKPKLVFFFDEAHLLFDGATDAFLDSVATTVRMIRSKGIGVFFVTQTPSEFYELDELLKSMGIGEAAVTILSETGVPTPVVHTKMVAPRSRMAPADDVDGAAKASPLWAKYGTRTDAQSAREILAARIEEPAPPPASDSAPTPEPKPRHKEAADAASSGGDALGKFLKSREGKAIQRQVIRGVFGMLRRKL
ncbi:MAG: helicase HerA-like domain-containing protein [Thermoleophilaceae bacterium]